METDFLNGTDPTIFWAVTILSITVAAMSLGLFIMWIYYSWIKRENSKNYNGKDLTEIIFQKTGNSDIKIIQSLLYAKYWNHNKKQNTYRLRHWTYQRRSIWTMMEAAQQAYVTTVRNEKGRAFWFIFRLPFVLRIVGSILGVMFLSLGIKDISGVSELTFNNWFWISVGVSCVFIFYMIADGGKTWILYKNVPALLSDCGLNEYEIKSIRRIYFWRFIYSVAAVVLEVVKLIIRLWSELERKR